ncbi:MAG: hypothetical protein KDA76_14760 [Planctomycetaceae bacterium]|nr:hypothetical protein [Planctomycetaceae bacterium]
MNRALILTACVLLVGPWAAEGSEGVFQFLSRPAAMNQEPESLQDRPLYELHPEFEMVIRGQTPPTYNLGPQAVPPGGMQTDPYFGGAQPQGVMPNQGMIYGNPQNPGYDPFLSSPYSGLQPDPYGSTYDINGPQPARLGWTNRWDFLYQASANLADGGEVTVFGVDWAADYTFQGVNGWLWTHTPEFNYREYNFVGSGNPLIQPNGGDPGIADNYYRFAYRFQTTSPSMGPFSYRLGFTPAIATDLQRDLTSQAWNLDADITMFYRVSPQWMWVAGVMYWDRAEDFIVPHAGAVWNPNQFWEIRAVYPNPRADVFIGTPFGLATWLYIGAEYNVESFQAGEIAADKAQLQVEEWRAFAGIRWEGCRFSSYLDFGYAFDRKWNIHSALGTSDLAPDDTFMLRYGVRY